MIHIEPLEPSRVGDAAALFVAHYAILRQEFPILSEELAGSRVVQQKLLAMGGRSLIAVENGRLTGYLAWWNVDGFRGSPRRGAYVPEWAHGATPGRKAAIYRTLYRAASAEWAAAGCGVHAITLLANDHEAREAWFWNGFGLTVVDAARSLAPLDPDPGSNLTIRGAMAEDAEALSRLDAEHVSHYSAPPVFMARPRVDSPAAFAEFVGLPKNSVWLALHGTTPAGFMRFSGYDFDAVAALQSDSAALCNGAYVRPEYRGQGAGRAMLQAAISHYAGLRLRGLLTNFESFNPEAASFWPRYFTSVCLSMTRIPEVTPEPSNRP